MAEPLPMHESFAQWYAAVSVDDDHARRDARWVGVSTIVGRADRSAIETLLRLAHKSRQAPPAAAVQAIRQAFKDADDTFQMNGNDRELQVLAAVGLAVLMQANATAGAPAALAATTAGLHGARNPDLPMDLAAHGEAAILRWGDANRKRPPIASQFGDVPAFDFEQAAKKMQEVQNWDGATQAFKLAAEATGSATKSLAERQARLAHVLDRVLRVQDEELQMLWWLIGQRSVDYDCGFEAVPMDVQPLVFASELARDTKYLPGPPSVAGILSRAGLAERKNIPISRAINAAKSEWLRGLVGEADVSPVSTPLHEAIKRQLETGAGDAWVAGWAASTGVDKDHPLSALTLGNLFYRERLLRLSEK
jgi:hypothetical protein